MADDAARADELEADIRRHNRLYFVENAPEIGDDEFDRRVEELKRLRPDSPVLAELGSPDAFLGEPWTHTEPMLSLDKCYDEPTLQRWADKWSGKAIQSPKVDGVAAAFIYGADGTLRVVATRGNGTKGEICTAQMMRVQGVPHRVSVPAIEVRGEVYMRLSTFERYRALGFANPRNTAAGAVKQKDPEKTRAYGLRFFAYDVLGTDHATETDKMAFLAEQGFSIVEGCAVDKSQMQECYEAWERRRDDLDFEIDGVVFKVDDVAQQRVMGATAHHPRYAIAYKLKTESRVTRLVRVEWSVSRTGAVTPVAIIEPTVLSGATVTNISLHNLGVVRKLGVTDDCTVRATRRGGVIPYVEEVVAARGEPVRPPSSCPSCDTPLSETGDFLQCDNRLCRARVIGVLEHYAKVVGAEGFGRAILEQSVDAGLLSDVDDFYRLTDEALLPLERMGKVLAAKLVRNVQAQREQTLRTFLVSLGISDVGPTVAGLLAAHYGTLDAVRAATAEELAGLDGIGEIIAGNVVEGLSRQADRVARLLEHVRFVAPADEAPEDGPLSGTSFVFTGKMARCDRKSAQAHVRSLGAATPGGVTKELGYLVVGDEGSPLFGGGKKGSKIKKAEKYAEQGAAIRVIPESEFLVMLEEIDHPIA